MGKNKTADLLQGALELLVLRLLQTRPLNGWDIMRRLQLVTGDVLTVTAGSLYPALHRLEARGFVTASWQLSENNRRARVYRITARAAASSSRSEKPGRGFPARSTRCCGTPDRGSSASRSRPRSGDLPPRPR